MFIGVILGLIVGAGIIAGAYLRFSKQLKSSVGTERTNIETKIKEVEEELSKLLVKADSFAALGQLENLSSQITGIKTQVEAEKQKLKEIETRLDTAQKGVDEKESKQQEAKASREQEEIELAEMTQQYESLSSESIDLERKLAEALKYLDTMGSEVELTKEQKDFVSELSSSCQSAGTVLRNLIGEYESVYQRLEALKMQHKDLEEEYTKLVEQQLGG